MMRMLIVLALLGGAAAGQDTERFVEKKVEVAGAVHAYRLLRPAKVVEGERYPVVLFLHGAGERGHDNEAQWRHFPEKMASKALSRKYPCFVVAPQCPRQARWVNVPWDSSTSSPRPDVSGPMQAAIAAFRQTLATEPVDPDRLYLTGLSMGGYGSWDLASRHREWFAAVAPICGGGDEREAHHLVGVPLWAWHGDADRAVPVGRSRSMIARIKACGGVPNYTELEGVGHDSWSAAYAADGMLDWMFRQRRSAQSEARDLLSILADPAFPTGQRIVFLGDSITQAGANEGGYVWQIDQALKKRSLSEPVNATVIGAGISGHKVPDLQKRLERDVLSKKPTLVFIYIGINDVWHADWNKGTPKEAYESGLRSIIERIRGVGAKVVLATPTVIGEKVDGSNKHDEELDAYAALSRKVAKDLDVALCDLRRTMLDALSVRNLGGASKGILTGDGVHLNAAGNRFLARQAALAITAALRAER